MVTIRFHQTTTATPEQFIAGLTDFGPGRSKLFENSADAYLTPDFRRWWAHESTDLGVDLRECGDADFGSCYYMT